MNSQDDADRFWSKVRLSHDTDCWNWQASLNRDGYGRFRLPQKHVSAHRFAFELTYGPIPEGLDLDHLCRNRRCVNPAHLEPVTERENTLRGQSIPAINARKTTCKRGHPLEGENLQLTAEGRRCRTCRRAASRAWRTRQAVTA